MRRPALLAFLFSVVLVTLACGLGACQDLGDDEILTTASLTDGSAAASETTTTHYLESAQPAAPRGAPTIAALNPQQGPEAGGNNVDIFGTGFTPDSEVTFGGVPAHNLHYVSSAQLQAQVEGHSPGSVEVVVRSPHGSSSTEGSVNDYTYVRGPRIYAVTPDSCFLGSSVWVVITGSGFEGVESVWFFPDSGHVGEPSPEWKQISSSEVRARVPSVDAPGVYEVEVSVWPGGSTHYTSDSAADFLFMDPSLLPTPPTFETIVYP